MFQARPSRRRHLVGATVSAAALLAVTSCGGVKGGGESDEADKNYPTKTVEWTAPNDPGGSTDLISRAVAKAMEGPLGQSVVVENKPGANGAVGGKEVLGRKPDGYSLVMLFQSLMAIGPHTVVDDDPIKMSDMDVISGLTVEDYVLVVPAQSEVETLDDLLAKKSVKYGTTGAGTGSELAQALLFGDAGVKAGGVPFDGGAPTVTALLGNQVDVGAIHVAEAAPHIESDKLRPLAVFAKERIDFLPDVPTAVESGHDVVVDQRRWVAGPAGLPDNVVSELQAALKKSFKDPAYGKFLKDNYIGRWEASPDDVVTQIETAKKRYGELIDKFGLDLKTEG
ncbi:tripartite tricarboxylate transporter substrate binding protein [Streptomyces sp. T-3]|nr:tripartite tricarboxylate transporter substrate binding protein [Streptomyces sp. T-3]